LIFVLIIAGKSHLTRLKEDELITDDFVEYIEDLVDNDMPKLKIVFVDY